MDTQKSRATIREKESQIQDALSKIKEESQKIADERDRISEKLQSKERECQLLSDIRGMLEKDLQREGEAYERINRDDKLRCSTGRRKRSRNQRRSYKRRNPSLSLPRNISKHCRRNLQYVSVTRDSSSFKV